MSSAAARIDMSLDDIIKKEGINRKRGPVRGGAANRLSDKRKQAAAKRMTGAKNRASAALARKSGRNARPNTAAVNSLVNRIARNAVRQALQAARTSRGRGRGGVRRQQRLPNVVTPRRTPIRGRGRGRISVTSRRGRIGVTSGRRGLRQSFTVRGRRSAGAIVTRRRLSAGAGPSTGVKARLGWTKQQREKVVMAKRGLSVNLGEKTKGRGNVGMMRSDIVEAEQRQQRSRIQRTMRVRGRGRGRGGNTVMERIEQRVQNRRRGRGRGNQQFFGRGMRAEEQEVTVTISPRQRVGNFVRAGRRGGGRARGGVNMSRMRMDQGTYGQGASSASFSHSDTGTTLNERFGGGRSRVKIEGGGRSRQIYF